MRLELLVNLRSRPDKRDRSVWSAFQPVSPVESIVDSRSLWLLLGPVLSLPYLVSFQPVRTSLPSPSRFSASRALADGATN